MTQHQRLLLVLCATLVSAMSQNSTCEERLSSSGRGLVQSAWQSSSFNSQSCYKNYLSNLHDFYFVHTGNTMDDDYHWYIFRLKRPTVVSRVGIRLRLRGGDTVKARAADVEVYFTSQHPNMSSPDDRCSAKYMHVFKTKDKSGWSFCGKTSSNWPGFSRGSELQIPCHSSSKTPFRYIMFRKRGINKTPCGRNCMNFLNFYLYAPNFSVQATRSGTVSTCLLVGQRGSIVCHGRCSVELVHGNATLVGMRSKDIEAADLDDAGLYFCRTTAQPFLSTNPLRLDVLDSSFAGDSCGTGFQFNTTTIIACLAVSLLVGCLLSCVCFAAAYFLCLRQRPVLESGGQLRRSKSMERCRYVSEYCMQAAPHPQSDASCEVYIAE